MHVCSIPLMVTSIYQIPVYSTSVSSFSVHVRDPKINPFAAACRPDVRIRCCRPRIRFFRFSDKSLCPWHLAPKRGCWTAAHLLASLKSRRNFKERCFHI
jgi:hypothetical protein